MVALASALPGQNPASEIKPIEGISKVAQFFREYRYLSEFDQPVVQGGSSHWSFHGCSMDKGARIRYDDPALLATYIARLRDRLEEMIKEADGEFSVGSCSGGNEQPFRLVARYRIGDRSGFIRLANTDVDLQHRATEGDFSLILWEIPVTEVPANPAKAEQGGAGNPAKPGA